MSSSTLTLLSFVIVLCCVSRTSPLYLNLFNNKPKCFYDNFYENMVIIMNYKILDEDIKVPNRTDLFEITIYTNNDKELVKTFTNAHVKGKFPFLIEKSGEYKVCIQTKESSLFTRSRRNLKLSFQIDTDEDVIDDAENSVKMKDFEMVNDKVKKVQRKITTLSSMQSYQNKVEQTFSDNQIRSSTLLVWLSMIQIVVIIVVGGFHVISLTKIFKQKIWTF